MSLVRWVRTLTPSLVVLAAIHLQPATVGAQSIEGGVFAGGALMTSDLTDDFLVDTGTRVETAFQSHDNALALGARLGLRWTAFAVEGTIAVVPTKMVTHLDTSQNITEDQTIIILGADALYTFISDRFLEFFLAAGGGIKSYSADDPAGGFESGSDPMFNVGVGARLFITPSMALRVDVRDYISSFDGFESFPDSDEGAKTQHDVLLTLGLSYRVGR